MYTKHGHHIQGTERLGTTPPSEIKACGGPANCGTCENEAGEILSEMETTKEVGFHYAVAVAELFEGLRHEIKANYQNSRERSLVLTNIDQAELWLTKCKEEPT